MEEQWINIPSFSSYEASNNGKIRNKKSKKELSLVEKGDGYIYVTMYQDKKYYNRSVHTLIAKSFIENPEKKPTVNHKNKNGLDNNLNNLEWATYSEQILHRNKFDKENGIIKTIKGKSIWKCNIENGDKIDRFDSITLALKSIVGETSKDISKITNNMNNAFGFSQKWDNEDIENEQWIDILSSNIDNNEDYKLSTKGRVKAPSGNILTSYKDKRGYHNIKIKDNLYQLNKLMALVFFNINTTNILVLNHKDGNKSNYDITNLEVISQSGNIIDAYNNNLIIKKNKIAVIQVDVFCNIIGEYESLTEAEAKTEINRGVIHHAINCNNTGRGYRWFNKIEDYENEKQSGELKKNFYRVIQCDKNTGEIIKTFENYPKASKAVGIAVMRICNSANSMTRFTKNFKWFKCLYDYEIWMTNLKS